MGLKEALLKAGSPSAANSLTQCTVQVKLSGGPLNYTITRAGSSFHVAVRRVTSLPNRAEEQDGKLYLSTTINY